ncbi:MAG: hypothetical protein RMK62_05085 [Armatimonadota bacterium]|nr:hypothetical protein [Armatimonadota bacterium]
MNDPAEIAPNDTSPLGACEDLVGSKDGTLVPLIKGCGQWKRLSDGGGVTLIEVEGIGGKEKEKGRGWSEAPSLTPLGSRCHRALPSPHSAQPLPTVLLP